MYLQTDFWSNVKIRFDHILFIDNRDKSVIFQVSLNHNRLDIKCFFRKVIKYSLKERNENAQFAVIHNGEIMPICWFDLVLDNADVIGRDFAFGTNLIRLNGVIVPLGNFPPFGEKKGMSSKRYLYLWSSNRKHKVFKRAMKFIANRV